MKPDIPNRTRLEWRRSYSGPEILRETSHLMFLVAGLWAALWMALWIPVSAGMLPYLGPGTPVTWHVHEIMFGFFGAALAGFLLSSVPPRTGYVPVRGKPLAALALIWLAGRVAFWFGGVLGPIPTAVVDLAFLAALVALVANELLAGRTWPNRPLVAGLVLFLVANVLFHLDPTGAADVEAFALRLALFVPSALLAIVGCHIAARPVDRWFSRRGRPQDTPPMPLFDRLTLTATLAGLVSWLVGAPEILSGCLLTVAAICHFARFLLWDGWKVVREPILVMWQFGYLWLIFGFGSLAFALVGGNEKMSASVHLLAMSGMGMFTCFVMSRALRRHFGRSYRFMLWHFVTNTLLMTAMLTQWAFEYKSHVVFSLVSATAWTLAFALFVALHLPKKPFTR